ncbi:hypothetical protein [Streptomyces sp. UNOC14_S4]|uniref:hypothetical protein n=1 Tax=Streptomyces sp. UNOC14_S4 TaxID=2872340 RepID=UPI001E2C92B9|nr:hypothetical protein [Streptomyces sp. UNOC14_S4]MCC3767323.1 hypothetical protein [Streptomyces sp. UNOC14_S4]
MGPRPRSGGVTPGPARVRGRELTRTVADCAADVLHPLVSVLRGLRVLAVGGCRAWARTPRDRRGPAVVLVGSCLAIVALVPYGPLCAAVALMVTAGWAGRERVPADTAGTDAEHERLQVLYECLVPYLAVPEDPRPLYAHGGDWREAFTDHAFEDGRLVSLRLRYPAHFTDSEAESRSRVEQLLEAKAGRGREYRFGWDQEANLLTVTVLPALPDDIRAQRFVTAPGETVLGFTDPDAVQRTLPVLDGDGGHRDAPPVVWRTGRRSTEPHLLALGRPAAGTTTLLRSIALQALHHGDVVLADGGGSGGYAFLVGREGVLAVESAPAGALAALEWAAHETERRLIGADQARQQGRPLPEDVRRPLWIVMDRPTALGHLAAGEGRPDPQELLDVPLRHGRAAGVTVVVGEHLENAGLLGASVLAHTRSRVVLGPVTPEQAGAALGAPPDSTPVPDVPPGRGYARLGSGPVYRVQVPATPDPFDEETSETERQAVLALLPQGGGAAYGTGVEQAAEATVRGTAGEAAGDAPSGPRFGGGEPMSAQAT